MDDGTDRLVSVALKSIGCRTNQEEMVALQFRLQQEGFQIVEQISDADVIIVNTCSVTSFTESKTRRLLNSLSQEAPQAEILVTGCLAQQKPQELKNFKSVTWVVGNTLKAQISTILANKRGGIFHLSFDTDLNSFEQGVPSISPDEIGEGFRTRFPLKIQEGCDNSCAYCIVPSVRGPSRSQGLRTVLETASKAIDCGYKELVLTGTHIGQFDKANGGLLNLLEHLSQLSGDFRIRLSSLDPRDLSSSLISLIQTEKKICKHLHVSVQSLCQDILRSMGRPCDDLEKLIETLAGFREKTPTAALGSDIIVGFPGETDENFRTTCVNATRIGFTYAHVFRYSRRPGTRAADFANQVSEAVKSEGFNREE